MLQWASTENHDGSPPYHSRLSTCAGDIGEYGCLHSHHCTGGAVCYQRRCVCPAGYIQTASGTKCAKRGGTHTKNNAIYHVKIDLYFCFA